MSAEIHALPLRHRAFAPGAPPLRPEIQDLLDRFTTGFRDRPSFTALPGGIAFEHAKFRTTLSFRAVDLAGRGGRRVTELGEVRTELPEAVQEISELELALFNSLATLGALVRDPGTGLPAVVSRTAILEGDDAELRHHGLLMHAAALSHVDQVLAAFMMACDGRVHEEAAWPRRAAGTEGPWPAQLLAEEAVRMRSHGYDASADGHGLHAAFPWPATDRWPLDGDRRASLLTISAREPHPMFGDGLSVRLELPVAPPLAERAGLANRLNQLEVGAADGAPFFGAWCTLPGTKRLAWVAFVADAWFLPGLESRLAAWATWRHRGVLEAVREGRV